MTDETKLAEQQMRGEAAKMILEHPLFVEAFAALDDTIVQGWKSTVGGDEIARERAYLMLRLSVNLKQWFVTQIANGSAASKMLLKLKEPSKIRAVLNG